MQQMKTNILVLFSIFLFISCSKEDSPEEIKQKQYPVYYTLNTINGRSTFDMITNIDYMRIFLEEPHPSNGNKANGNKGIFIIRWEAQTRAFDVACPYEWDNRIALFSSKEASEMGQSVTCPSCDSEFDPFTGKALSGKAKNAGIDMVQYKVEIRNMEKFPSEKELVVTN